MQAAVTPSPQGQLAEPILLQMLSLQTERYVVNIKSTS